LQYERVEFENGVGMDDFKVVVVGGSAGGVEIARTITRDLPASLNAAVFITLHLSPTSESVFAELLDRTSQMNVCWARDGAVIEAGNIYVAPPDEHMLVERGYVRLGRGPRENGHRPAVDPLFRTAAHAYCDRTIGVIISGNLDDGSAGLKEIRKMGGKAVVQDPKDALYDGMPLSAIDVAGADDIVKAAQLSERIVALVIGTTDPSLGCGEDMPEDIAAGGETPMSADEREAGERSVFGCPDCGGVLWEIKDGELVRFRCRVGHAYTEESLLEAMGEGVERAMWAALRALEEQAVQGHNLAKRMKARNHQPLYERFTKRALEAEERAAIVRAALLKSRAESAKAPDAR
jgi:two-component system chemotaxis response regulator CheB